MIFQSLLTNDEASRMKEETSGLKHSPSYEDKDSWVMPVNT